jgi:hypothetical protein
MRLDNCAFQNKCITREMPGIREWLDGENVESIGVLDFINCDYALLIKYPPSKTGYPFSLTIPVKVVNRFLN